MKFHVITLFPELIEASTSCGLLGQARKKNLVQVETLNPRRFATDTHKTVDDRPYGGGDGMIMKAEPLALAVEDLLIRSPGAKVILMSPRGQRFDNQKAKTMAAEGAELIFICGRYGGVDERFTQTFVDEEISIGDYVLSGGELAAAVIIEAVSRFLPGVLGHQDSAQKDSFESMTLEYPQYTRPAEWRGQAVPEVLTSGDPKSITEWQECMSWHLTKQRRPDLFSMLQLTEAQLNRLNKFVQSHAPEKLCEWGLNQEFLFSKVAQVHIALLHYPILDRDQNQVATNITNFDIHDIARACRTYGIETYTLIHPQVEQLMFVDRILDHWRVGQGAAYNPSRKRALERVKTASSLESLVASLKPDLVIGTHARPVSGGRSWSCRDLRQEIWLKGKSVLVVFGTGYGMTETTMQNMDGVLESLRGPPPDDFRHLSVRSAVSVYLDRLMSAAHF